ncbi:protein-methionine-sulfoxide reductase heme-binding subunit MsrQ [Lentibacter algarum]|nr:protein-methionine-sulfoxide reductase heme-binding subunit MsrQ [Lentibacter algarum]
MKPISDHLNALVKRVPAWPLYILCMGHVFWLFYQGLNGALGPEPIKALEHAYGEAGLKVLIAVLAVTPLRKYVGLNLLKFRRALGLSAFIYILSHLLVWLVLDLGNVALIWADIVKRPYITVGMVGFALLLPLAATSNNASIRRLGATRWRKLHKLTYLAAILGAAHFIMLVKGIQIEPLVFMAVILGLIGTRFWARLAKTA